MRLYKKIIFLICLCMNMGGCVSLPTYSDPRVDGMADSQIAILENRRLDSCLLCVARITDADGKNIPVKSSEQHPALIKGYKKHFEKHRLLPGEYEIAYGIKRHRRTRRVYNQSRVVLKAGHVYAVREETCTTFCFRMDSNTSDIWLEDITTGEWIGGCRQGMGCVLNGQIKPYPHFTPPSPLMD